MHDHEQDDRYRSTPIMADDTADTPDDRRPGEPGEPGDRSDDRGQDRDQDRDQDRGEQSGQGRPDGGESRPPQKPLGPTPGGGSGYDRPTGHRGPVGFGGSGATGAPGAGAGGSQPTNPFEALMAAFGGGAPGAGAPGAGAPGGQPDMNAFMQQLQSAFAMLGGPGGVFGGGQAPDGGVNWDVTKDTARKTAASLGADPTPGSAERRELEQAASIADTWLDEATSFPRTGTAVEVWSRAEWIERTIPVWRRLVEPVASHIADAMEGALSFSGEGEDRPEVAQLAGLEQMLRPMLRSSGASMFGLQLGQGLGRLATEVVGATDIGLPLAEDDRIALIPTNVTAFGDGLDQSSTDVTLYLTLREAARTRLFAAAPWLREQMLVLVEQYARGITIDTSALEQAVGELDMSGLDASGMEELSKRVEGGLFAPQKTPEQQATLERLETMLALVEGWVDDVVETATARWMPAAAALAETVRRRRATGGPAEQTFATLVGLELRPRRMRDAANLWAAVRDARGTDGRDAVWSHPDLIPTSADLDDPIGFARGTEDEPGESADDDFDAALAELLDEAERARDDDTGGQTGGGSSEEPGDGGPGDPGAGPDASGPDQPRR